MITTIHKRKKVRVKRSDLLKYLYSKDVDKILQAVELILHESEGEFTRIEGFYDDCTWVKNKIQEGGPRSRYDIPLSRITRTIENHGAPRYGHLDDAVKGLLKKLESTDYKPLLEDRRVARSYEIVREHLTERTHSQDYEAHANLLYERISIHEKNMRETQKK